MEANKPMDKIMGMALFRFRGSFFSFRQRTKLIKPKGYAVKSAIQYTQTRPNNAKNKAQSTAVKNKMSEVCIFMGLSLAIKNEIGQNG